MASTMLRITKGTGTMPAVIDGQLVFNTATQKLYLDSGTTRYLMGGAKTSTPSSLTISLNGVSQGAWDGSSAKSINITPNVIGAVQQTTGANDLNTIYDTGFYNVTSGALTNGPSSYSYGQLIVMAYRKHLGNTTPDYAVQLYAHAGSGTSPIPNALAYRTSSKDSWNEWQMTAHGKAGTAVGESTKPVYMASDGTITLCGNSLSVNITGNATTCGGTALEWSGEIAWADTGWIAAWNNNGTKIKALNKNYFAPASHSHSYLPLTGGTLSGSINFQTIASWPTVSGETYPINSAGLYWNGSSDLAKIFYRVAASDSGHLIIQLGDATDETVVIENTAGTVYAKIGNGGVTANNFYGNATTATKATQDGSGNTITSTYLKRSGGTMTGTLEMQPGGSSVEGGEIHLCASASANTVNGIVLDNYSGTFRVFGIASADGTTKTGTGTALVIDPYAKTITGGYTITGTLNGNASSASSVAWGNITNKPSTFTPSAHNHGAGDITSGTLPIARGGTGQSSDYAAFHKLIFRGGISDANACMKRGLYTFSTAATNIPGPASGTGAYGCIETIIANDIAEGVAIGGTTSSSWVWQLGWNTSYENMFIRRSINAGNFTSWKKMWLEGDLITGAVWNDYAEYRSGETTEPGKVVKECPDGILRITESRLEPGCEIISDTFGFAIGETEDCKTPIAASGRVLAYPFEDRNTFELGQAVCSGPNGTVSKMTREEIMMYPERIIGTVSEIPNYETWGTGNVQVNGRIWIRIR